MDKLKSYIENARSKGYSDERIKDALTKAGWSADRVEAALVANSSPPHPDNSQATPVQQPGAVSSLQTNNTEDVNLESLNIDSDKPVAPVGGKKPGAGKKPLHKRLLPILGFCLIVLIGLVIAVNGLKAYNHTRVPRGFVITKGQIAFSIPGKKGQYDTRVNFKTPDGGSHSFVTPTPPGDNNNSRYVAGDGMKVAYYPQNPDMTALDLTDRGSPIFGLALTAVGVLLTLIGAFFLQRQFRHR
jgi:hypothetical protein